MSLVVAIQKDGVVYFGADTRASDKDYIYKACAEEELKVRRVGDCLVAAVGDVATLQEMMNQAEWFELHGKPLTKKHLVRNVIPFYYERLAEKSKLNEKKEHSCEYLVTDGKKLFAIYDDFSVCEIRDYVAIGCARTLANVYWWNSSSKEAERDLILTILREAAYRDAAVGAPFVLIDTKRLEYEFVEV